MLTYKYEKRLFDDDIVFGKLPNSHAVLSAFSRWCVSVSL